ncbi:ABC transporter permease [Paenibacillus apiarius]|uniref:ABC transporter permease n=1 Tax=Paenibacillus apiarius TaxID=46240 RepID=UPI003B3A7A1B
MKMKLSTYHREGTLYLVILYSLMSMIIVTASYYIAKQEELNILSRGLYAEDNLFFVIEDTDLTDIPWNDLSAAQSYTIFKELQTGKETIRAVYYNQDTYQPPIRSGRYFNKHDFYAGKRVAVVGAEIERDNIVDKQGKPYLTYQGEQFEIIGKMGASYPSFIDHMILLNLDAVDQQHHYDSSIYAINAQAGNTLIKNGLLPIGDAEMKVRMFKRGDSGSQRFLGTDLYSNMIVLAITVLLIGSSILFALHWMKRKQQELHVLWIAGIQHRHPFKRYTLRFLAMTALCYGIIAGIGFLIMMNRYSLSEVIKSFATYLIMGGAVMFITSFLSILLAGKEMYGQLAMERNGR